jgi:hypothetical protein
MKSKIILLALLLTVGLTTTAWSQGIIWGNITYKNCECNSDDRVCIRPVSGGRCTYIPIVCSPGPRFHSYPVFFPFGEYYISVILHDGSNCGYTFIQRFNHIGPNDRCDLSVHGPDGEPDSPDPGP